LLVVTVPPHPISTVVLAVLAAQVVVVTDRTLAQVTALAALARRGKETLAEVVVVLAVAVVALGLQVVLDTMDGGAEALVYLTLEIPGLVVVVVGSVTMAAHLVQLLMAQEAAVLVVGRILPKQEVVLLFMALVAVVPLLTMLTAVVLGFKVTA
jgi:hypothetical protein